MGAFVHNILGAWTAAPAYPVLDTQLIEAIFPANAFVNTAKYINIAGEKSGAYTYIAETIPTTPPTLDGYQEGGMFTLDSTPISASVISTDFWGLGFDIPQQVTEDIPYNVLGEYTKRLMLKTAFTRDKHVERQYNTAINQTTSGAAGTNYGYNGSFTVAGVMSTVALATAIKKININNVEPNTLIMASVNAADTLINPLFTAQLYYDNDSGINSGAALFKQSTAPVGKLRGMPLWCSNVCPAGTAYVLAVGTDGVVPNNQYSQFSYFVEKRPPMSKDLYWADTDTYQVRLSTRFHCTVVRAFHGATITSLNTT